MSSLVQKEKDITIVGKIEDGSKTLESMNLSPDIFVLDSLLFTLDELPRLVHELKRASPRTRIHLLFLQGEIPDEALIQCLMKGADGYITRAAKLKQLVEAIRAVHAGNIWADRKLLEKFVRYAPFHMSDLGPKASKLENALTKREKEVVSFLFLGLPNRLISQKLHISEKTVKTHLNNIFKKMQVHNRTQVVAAFMDLY